MKSCVLAVIAGLLMAVPGAGITAAQAGTKSASGRQLARTWLLPSRPAHDYAHRSASKTPPWFAHSSESRTSLPAPLRTSKTSQSSYVARVIFAGKPKLSLNATAVYVEKTTLPSRATSPEPRSGKQVLAIALAVSGVGYWHRLISAERGTKRFGEATVFVFRKKGGSGAVTYTLTSPEVRLEQEYSGYESYGDVTLIAGNWRSRFTGEAVPLSEAIVGQVALHTHSGRVDRFNVANFSDTPSGQSDRALSFDLAATSGSQAYEYTSSFTFATVNVWTGAAKGQVYQYSLANPSASWAQSTVGQSVHNQLTLVAEPHVSLTTLAGSAPPRTASASKPVGSISVPTGNGQHPSIGSLHQFQFYFDPNQTDQRYTFYLDATGGVAALALMKSTIGHVGITVLQARGGRPLETFSLDGSAATYTAYSTGAAMHVSASLTDSTATFSQLFTPQDNPKNPSGSLTLQSDGTPATITGAIVYLPAGGTGPSQANVQLPSGPLTVDLQSLAYDLTQARITLHDGHLLPHGAVATIVLGGAISLTFSQYFPNNQEPLTDEVNLESQTTTESYAEVTGSHDVSPGGSVTLHMGGGGVTLPAEATSVGYAAGDSEVTASLPIGVFSTELLSGQVNATVTVLNHPNGTALSRYQFPKVAPILEEEDFNGYALDWVDFGASQSVTYTGQSGRSLDPAAGTISIPAGTNLHVQPVYSISLYPGAATSNGAQVSGTMMVRSAALDTLFFASAFNNTSIPTIGLELTKKGNFADTLYNVHVTGVQQNTDLGEVTSQIEFTAEEKS